MAINLKALEPHKVSRDLSGYIIYLYGQGGTGKAQPISTKIPTPQGIKQLKDISPGDEVFDRFGKPTKVLAVFPQGRLKKYKVTFSDGRVTYCNDEHLWTYYTSRNNFYTRTLKELMDLGIERKDQRGYNIHPFSIPTNKAVQYECNNTLSIPPYVLGAFLGDGCCKERILTFSSADEEIVAKIAKLINSNYKKISDKNFSWSFPLKENLKGSFNHTITNYQTARLFKNYADEIMVGAEDKRIPDDYKFTSIENRWELIQGLFDTDGSITQDGKNIRYTSINYKLIKDIQEIINSLGYSTTISKDNRSDKYITGACYSLRVQVPNKDKHKFFSLSRKKDIANSIENVANLKKYDRIQIISAEYTGETEEMVCLYVDNPEHLYLTNDYIVTHNTTFGSKMPKPLLLASNEK